MLMQPAKLAAKPYPVFFYDPDEKATNRGHNPGDETPPSERSQA